MKFNFIIGNPPYQMETQGGNKFRLPIYHKFLESSYQISDRVELIHPARFLFNAGATPKKWNQKMLNDTHLKVIYFWKDSEVVFPDTEIKGGVAITYRDSNKNFGAIGTFTAYPELNDILQKIQQYPGIEQLSGIAIPRYAYHFTEKMHMDHPEAISQLNDKHLNDLVSNIFKLLPQIFFDVKPKDGEDYIQILGRIGNKRVYKYIRAGYINNVKNLYKYKVYIPKAYSSSMLGQPIPCPIIANPGMGATETFLGIGSFGTKEEAISLIKYIKTKFARILIGSLKPTQNCTPHTLDNVPLQNFTSTSDINWSKPIPEIGQQLYHKYGLNQHEIDFIESNAKEMK